MQIGSYRIESQLGEGGMGTVYRALDTKLNRPVAIKFLSSELADAAARRRFQREAQTASSLNHPHILTVHDAGEFEGRQYLVTEFVAPRPMRRPVCSPRSLPALGTVAYMSPEQASGRPADARSDVFSFGVLLYELVAGRRPFAGATELEVLTTIIHGAPQPMPKDVPAPLRAVRASDPGGPLNRPASSTHSSPTSPTRPCRPHSRPMAAC